MKFKKLDKDDEYAQLSITDKSGDTLRVETAILGSGLYVFTNDNVGVRLTKGKALKLAWAIIEELDPQPTY
jgi:hypothetical protein